jgi:extradiol dioxygenase family protein
VRHFGIVLPMNDWEAMAERLKARGIDFIIEPYIRFQGQPGEQATMFFLDPSGNALESRRSLTSRCSSPNDPDDSHA